MGEVEPGNRGGRTEDAVALDEALVVRERLDLAIAELARTQAWTISVPIAPSGTTMRQPKRSARASMADIPV